MGGCISGPSEIDTHSLSSQLFLEAPIDNSLSLQVLLIPDSSFFHLLRKQITTEMKRTSRSCRFVHTQPDPIPEVFCSSRINADHINNSDKIIFDLLNLVIIDQLTTQSKLSKEVQLILVKFKGSNIKPNKIMVFNNAVQFNSRFPIFSSDSLGQSEDHNVLHKFNVPLLLFDSRDLRPIQSLKQAIFIHNQHQYKNNVEQNPTFYKDNFQIDDLNVTTLSKGLAGRVLSGAGNKLLVHSSEPELWEFLKEFTKEVSAAYHVHQSHVYYYLSNKVKVPAFLECKVPDTDSQDAKQGVESDGPVTKQQELQQLLASHYKEHRDINVTETTCNLLNMLIDNLLRNEDNQNFRRIKSTNKQLNQHIFRYKSGRLLVESLGFREQADGTYRNDMENKYLSLFKVDLALALKAFKSSLV